MTWSSWGERVTGLGVRGSSLGPAWSGGEDWTSWGAWISRAWASLLTLVTRTVSTLLFWCWRSPSGSRDSPPPSLYDQLSIFSSILLTGLGSPETNQSSVVSCLSDNDSNSPSVWSAGSADQLGWEQTLSSRMTVPSLIIIPSLTYSRVLTELMNPWERKSATLPSRPCRGSVSRRQRLSGTKLSVWGSAALMFSF